MRSERTAHAWLSPTETERKAPAGTSARPDHGSPPQQASVSSLWTPQNCSPPPVIDLKEPAGGVSPQKLWPQQSTPASASRTAQVWRPAAATSVNRPAGTSPDVAPQHSTVASSPRTAHECAEPDATAVAPVGAALATPLQPSPETSTMKTVVPTRLSILRIPPLEVIYRNSGYRPAPPRRMRNRP